MLMTRLLTLAVVFFVVILAWAGAGCDVKSSFAPTPPPLPGPLLSPMFPPLRVNPNGAAIPAGQKATFVATGGDGNYSWSASGGLPSAGSGSSFTTVFYRGGTTEYVTVISGDGQKATCEIGVATPPQKES